MNTTTGPTPAEVCAALARACQLLRDHPGAPERIQQMYPLAEDLFEQGEYGAALWHARCVIGYVATHM